MEQSLVGKVLSSWAMRPPMEGSRSTRWTWSPWFARSSAAWQPATPAADHDDAGGHHRYRPASLDVRWPRSAGCRALLAPWSASRPSPGRRRRPSLRRDLRPLGHDRAGPDQRVLADHGPVQDDRAHADEDPVADGAAVQDRAVADRDLGADRDGSARGAVDHAVVLDVRVRADGDPVPVGPDHGPEPDPDPVPERDFPEDRRVRREKDVGPDRTSIHITGEVATERG